MENPVFNCEDGRKTRSKNVQIRLLGHCIICLRKVSAKRLEISDNFIESTSLVIALKSVVSAPGFLTTFNQVWEVVQSKWKEKNNIKKDGNGLPEEIGISLENVLRNGCMSTNVSFSRAPTICQLCCDKVLAVMNLMKAVRQQVREISIILEEGRRRQCGGLGNFEKNLRESGLEESVIRATTEFVGIFDGIHSQADVEDDHISPAPPDMPCVISAAESVEEPELGRSEVDSDEDIEDDEGQTVSETEEDDDEDPDYLKEENEQDKNDKSTDDEGESEEEMEVDEDDDKNDPDFKVGKDPLALLPDKPRRGKGKPFIKTTWINQHGSGYCEKKNIVEEDASKFPCGCGKAFATFAKLRDHMRKGLKNHPEYKPFSFRKPNENGSDVKEDGEGPNGEYPCSCGKTFENASKRSNHMRRHKDIHQEFGNVQSNRQICELCGKWVLYNDILEHLTGIHLNGQEEFVIRCPNEKCRYLSVSSKEFNSHFNFGKYKECKAIWKEKFGPVCEICGFRGTNMLKIRNHVRDKHENGQEKKWKCPISGCGKMFFIKQSVQYHMHEHRYRPPITEQVCDKCEGKFKIEEIEEHFKDKHGVNEVIGCKQCGMKFSEREEMVDHLYEHRGVGISCDICGEDKFGRYSNFREHYFAVHKICPKKYKCGEGDCEMWFWSNETKEEHELRMHKEGNVRVRYKQLLVGERGKRKKEFGCDLCNVKFVAEINLICHNIKFHGADPFRCEICGETFHVKDKFSRHKREHAGIVFQKEWKCEVEGCGGKTFKDRKLWKRHQDVSHGGEKKHVCEICGKSYCDAGGLKSHHDSVHLGLRPYVCEECGEGFSSSTILKRHKLIHTGERPFGCEICGQRFRHKEVLRRHMVGHEEKGAEFKPNGPMKQIRKRKAQ